jgi:hypothetical protein
MMTRDFIIKGQENIKIKKKIEDEMAKDRHMMV